MSAGMYDHSKEHGYQRQGSPDTAIVKNENGDWEMYLEGDLIAVSTSWPYFVGVVGSGSFRLKAVLKHTSETVLMRLGGVNHFLNWNFELG